MMICGICHKEINKGTEDYKMKAGNHYKCWFKEVHEQRKRDRLDDRWKALVYEN